jgi:hypothetical protein
MTLIFGIVALVMLWGLLTLFKGAQPAALARALKLVGGVVSLAAATLIGVRGNLPVAIPLGMFGLGLLGWMPFGPAGFSARTQKASGRQSKVRSNFLEMTLDHDTGALAGDIVAGPYAGRSLSEFDLPALTGMIAGFDDESRALLAAYLDRRFPDWRDHAGADAPRAHTPSSGKMTRDEAWQVLGLAPGAGEDAITAAHRTLMKKLHPDQGGSNYLASRVNEARDLLLGK